MLLKGSRFTAAGGVVAQPGINVQGVAVNKRRKTAVYFLPGRLNIERISFGQIIATCRSRSRASRA